MVSTHVKRAVQAVLLGSLILGGCKKKQEEPSGTSVSTVAPTAAPTSTQPKPKPPLFHVPIGPMFGVDPGGGLGPIRFGAYLSTIERLIEAPCPGKSEPQPGELLCRYPVHAIEFYLKDNELYKIHVHGSERQVPGSEDQKYGIFNGVLGRDGQLGMYREFIVKNVGEPTSTETLNVEGPGTVQRDHYDGMTLEYDRLANGNVVLAGIVLTKAAGSEATAAPGQVTAQPAAQKPGAQKPAVGTATAPKAPASPSK